jgi:hypothetical protein
MSMQIPSYDENVEESIRVRAYEIWEREGRPAGKHFEHWHQSELEMGRAALAKSPSENHVPSIPRKKKSKSKQAKADAA